MPHYTGSSAGQYSGFSGDVYVDSILSGWSWAPTGLGTTTLTVSFPWLNGSEASFVYSNEPGAVHGGVTMEQRADILLALQAWSNVANIDFVAVDEDEFGNVGDIRFGFSEAVGDWWGWGYYPTGGAAAGDVWIHTRYMADSFAPRTYNFYATLHEIGHALGLDHSFDGMYAIPAGSDDRRYSIMSYTDPLDAWWYNPETGQSEYLIAGPMVYDIAAIQFAYGANMSFHAGNDVYMFAADQPFIQAIWDAGGTDTINLSDFDNGCTIDLTPGAYSTTAFNNSAVQGNLGIAFNCIIENVIGGSGDDHIGGNSARNVLTGGAGNDWLFGGLGNDRLRGGAGDDTLDGGGGTTDLLDGGAGNDVLMNGFANYTSAAAAVSVDLRAGWGTSLESGDAAHVGTDQLQTSVAGVFGSDFGDLLRAATAGSALYGELGNDTLVGRGGADLLDGGSGDDVIDGGNGNDTASYAGAAASVTVNLSLAGPQDTGGAGIDTLGSIENLLGTSFDDLLTGNGLSNLIDGADGDDTMTGGAGSDIYYVDGLGDLIIEFSGDGLDTVRSSVTYILGATLEQLRLLGTASINATGNTLDNVLIGNSGNNIIDGGTGADTMKGDAGHDIYYVNSSRDVVVETGGQGVDTVRTTVSYTLGANLEQLSLLGTASINATGNGLNNLLVGNSGNNIIDGGTGGDTMKGGAGSDTYYVNSGRDVVVESGGEGLDTVRSEVSYVLGDNVEQLRLTGTASINGTGNALDNLLVGNSGNNTLDGGTGGDTMKGGAGNDTYYVNSSRDAVTEISDEGADAVRSSVSYVLGDNVEQLRLLGTADIKATGNGLDNLLVGNSGDNLITGGAGSDDMKGEGGADTFLFDDGHFGGTTAGSADAILDFSQVEGDRIDLSRVDADSNVDGDQAFTFIGTGAFSHTAGELRTFAHNGTNYLAGDLDGDGVADFLINLAGSSVSTSDLTL